MTNFENSLYWPRNYFEMAWASLYKFGKVFLLDQSQWKPYVDSSLVIYGQPSLNRYINGAEIPWFIYPNKIVALLTLRFGEFGTGHDCWNLSHNNS